MSGFVPLVAVVIVAVLIFLVLFEPTHAARRGMRAVVLGTLDDPDLLRIELPKISESVADYWALFDIHLFGKPPKLSFLA